MSEKQKIGNEFLSALHERAGASIWFPMTSGISAGHAGLECVVAQSDTYMAVPTGSGTGHSLETGAYKAIGVEHAVRKENITSAKRRSVREQSRLVGEYRPPRKMPSRTLYR